MRAILCIGVLVTFSLSGCMDSLGGGSASGSLSIALDDDTTGVEFGVSGIFARAAGTEDGWVEVAGADDGLEWVLDGDGDGTDASASVTARSYDLLQVTFHHVKMDGTEAVLTEGGFLLPVPFNVTDGGTTQVTVGFAWADALFESQQGLAFAPALRKVQVVEDGVTTVDLEAAEIEAGGTKPPVARMRVLDEVWQIWESDFLAESDSKRKKGTAGNLTFLSSTSEALAPGSTLESYVWTFNDGVTLEGQTVNRVFDLNGGNFSVTLTVTDSNGVSDTQRLDLALAPGSATLREPFSIGPLTGLTLSGECSTGEGTFEVDVDPTVTPAGSPAGVSQVTTEFKSQAPHPLAKIDMRVFDGDGGVISVAASGGVTAETPDRSATKNYDPAGAQPAAGTWIVKAQPCKAVDITVNGFLTIVWEGVGDPAFTVWYEGYDDGENR